MVAVYLYHVTYLHSLPSILEHGLQPGRGQSFAGGYTGRSTGKIFLTEVGTPPGAGVEFWAHKLGDMADNRTDNPEEGWSPVVLRVRSLDIPGGVEDDAEGTRDALTPAYYTEEGIPVDALEVYDGGWMYAEDVDEDDVETMQEDALEASERVEEDGEAWWQIDYEALLPFDYDYDEVDS